VVQEAAETPPDVRVPEGVEPAAHVPAGPQDRESREPEPVESLEPEAGDWVEIEPLPAPTGEQPPTDRAAADAMDWARIEARWSRLQPPRVVEVPGPAAGMPAPGPSNEPASDPEEPWRHL
jgi:hypothetical protein